MQIDVAIMLEYLMTVHRTGMTNDGDNCFTYVAGIFTMYGLVDIMTEDETVEMMILVGRCLQGRPFVDDDNDFRWRRM